MDGRMGREGCSVAEFWKERKVKLMARIRHRKGKLMSQDGRQEPSW